MTKEFTHKANICHLENGIQIHYIRKHGRNWIDDRGRLFEPEFGCSRSDNQHKLVLDINSISEIEQRKA